MIDTAISFLIKGSLFVFFNVVYAVCWWHGETFSKAHNAAQAHTTLVWTNEKHQNALQENHPPVVKITAPANKSSYPWNTSVSYSISVSDKEDGESQYQEIASNEVFLEVNYLPNASMATVSKQVTLKEQAGLTLLKTSNCFNCHAVHTKGIGPSFSDISKKYTFSKPHIDLLTKRVQAGSTGIWGTASMPSHPELTQASVQQAVQWILKNAAQPNLNIYRGLEGSFRLTAPASKQKGSYVLTATYTDHGQPRLQGRDVIIVQGK